MGKRKSSRKPVKKTKVTLDTTFSCLFCNHERSVTATLDKSIGIGTLLCKVCGQTFQASINALSEPVDVYSEWVDACEAVAKRMANGGGSEGENGLGGGFDEEEEEAGGYEEEAHAKPKVSRGRRSAVTDDEDDEDDLF